MGPKPLEVIGLVGASMACVAIPWAQKYWETYLPPLLLVGVSWSVCYVTSTTHLAMTVQPQEKYRAQIIFDSLVFGTSTTINFIIGPLLEYLHYADYVIAAFALTVATSISAVIVVGMVRRRTAFKN